MQSDPSALVHASCLSLSLEPSGVGPKTSRPERTVPDEASQPNPPALEVTYPNLSSKVAETRTSTSKWEHATPIIPSTPRRHGPNIGKRRGYTPDLSRSAKSLSHSTKMAKIFEEASAGLQEPFTTPSRNMSANTKRFRLPLSRHKDRLALKIIPIDADSILSPQRIGVPSEMTPESTLPTIPLTPPAVPLEQLFPTPMPYNDTPCGAKHVDYGNREPPSSGFAEPAAITREASSSGSDLNTRLRDLPSSPLVIGLDVDDEECHSSHGVPLIISVTHPEPNKIDKFFIEAWLNDVPNSCLVPDVSSACESQLPCPGGDYSKALDKTPRMPQGYSFEEAAVPLLNESCRTPSRASSNKENVHPLLSPLVGPPPTLTPLPLSSTRGFHTSSLCPIETPSRTKLPFTSSSASRFQQFRTPGGFFAVTPARQKMHQPTASGESAGTMTDKTTHVNDNRTTPVPIPAPKLHSNSVFEIHEDPIKPDGIQLSPAVECFRKGRGPKRAKARCASYYDTDVLGENTSPLSGRGGMAKAKRKMGKERRPLGMHDESEEICTPKAFVEKAEGAKFEYRVQVQARQGL